MANERDLELRRGAALLRAQNPNYFGNFAKIKGIKDLPKEVFKKVGDTTFEELTCLGFNPDTDVLTAIVRVKLGSGYSGGPCTDGSYEFVRFYLDYGDGVWVDSGLGSFAVHDLGFPDPLCYAVSVKIVPERRTCCDKKSVLPKVRAILSWNDIPPANTPAWAPVWGNVLVRDIQIEPRNPIICAFEHLFEKAGNLELDPKIVEQLKLAAEAVKPVKPVAPVVELVKGAEREVAELHAMRTVFPVMHKIAQTKDGFAGLKSWAAMNKLEIDLSKLGEFVLKPKFNTTFEELTGVGYDRDLSLLHGIVQVKRASGYSGGLCTQGSREYVAFYLDFGSGWEYMGTTWVVAHDVTPMPKGGLWYQAALPVSLEKHRKEWCATGRAKIRGILSWAVAPTPGDPGYVAHWGDWEECWLEVKPLPKGTQPGVLTPVLEAIGSMPVDFIDGAGYANGPSVGGTFTADDSPFGGIIKFSGVIAFPSPGALEYRVMVKAPSDAAAKPWDNSFKVNLTTVSGGTVNFSNPWQVATGGWFSYLPQSGPMFKSVAENLLAVFSAAEEGLHTVYIEVRGAGTTTVLATSAVEAFYVDNTGPQVDVEIISGTGNCGKFGVGDVISGTFYMTDKHARSLSLSVTPLTEAAGGHIRIDTAVPAGPMAVFPVTENSPPTTAVSLTYGASQILTGGVTSGEWTLETADMLPCGYNIRIQGVDRAIVNSSGVSWENWDIEGFCLE